uniref:Exonuclease domain-containing protein n=1 Tax=Heliothis virescens TaxID=7102 RepID=A0A2A4J5V7_HELVI
MGKIATYLFLDVQSTGYPGSTHGEVRITELCMIAVKKLDVKKSKDEPRIQYKFRLCFNPEKRVEEQISQQNGLTQAVLKSEAKFNNDVYSGINSFIKCLMKPVCMIAHNAFKLHFPLLKYHINKMQAALPDDLLCTDSIYCFYDIFNTEIYTEPRENTEENCNKAEENESFNSGARKSDEDQIKRHMKGQSYENLVQSVFYEVAPKELYNLSHVYRSVTTGNLGKYSAENNCRMIMKIAIENSDRFIEWVELNHCPFSQVPITAM